MIGSIKFMNIDDYNNEWIFGNVDKEMFFY